MVKIGDRVRFLNDVGGGVVTSFVNKTTVNVEGEDGFEIPYPVSQLVNLSEVERVEKGIEPEPAPERITENVKNIPEPQQAEGMKLAGKTSPDFYFCFVPDDSKNPLTGETRLVLVNDSNFTLLYYYSHYRDEKYELVKFGSVQPNSKVNLESIEQNDLTDLPDFVFQLLYFQDNEKELHQSVAKKFKVSPVKFYKEKSFQPNVFFRKNAMVLQITPNVLAVELDKLTDDDLQKVVKSKEKAEAPQTPFMKKSAEVVEVDLHIQELLDDASGLSNREMLEIQLEKVESEMNEAIRSHVKRIVFIHGLGQGVLKQEVTRLLKSKFPKYYFQDASFKEYGYGATMVILRKG
ncbi:DUF2027 domain-containing protein [Maribellus comscasis]|uniref:DUF2027 domain-containing protein n=1 Tax=Maribellus comscasis TaxID=2681766 RepID=A0A6I6JY13_9BACT|nr:DUF2027 domain-containing protein [Maribellus comscasis]QGY46038.1 DUF2027 domain-containing protein [Maribellus comscasis]